MTDRPIGVPPLAIPKRPIPRGACDAHAHMLAGPQEFPLWPGRTEDPAPGTFELWLQRYREHLATLGFERGVIVHTILYGDDNAITIEAVRRLGTDRFRAIALVTDLVDDATLNRLADQAVVGVRLNYVHGGVLSWAGVRALAPRLRDRSMHVQMLLNADRHMVEIAEDVRRLPVPVCFDHIGWPDLGAGIEEPGFRMLCALLAEGRAWVKLSGVYRLCGPAYRAADEAVAALVDANPERCVWGSDWPHLMLADASTPDSGALLDALDRVVTDERVRRRVLVENPAALYGFV
ncbi:MAG: amidohydrolase family protein [Pseudomonadota bacterium]